MTQAYSVCAELWLAQRADATPRMTSFKLLSIALAADFHSRQVGLADGLHPPADVFPLVRRRLCVLIPIKSDVIRKRLRRNARRSANGFSDTPSCQP